jgi:ribonuclease VapC
VNECVLDASAILACLNDEPGGHEIATLTREAHCLVSTVNWSEVLTRLLDWGLTNDEAYEAATSIDIQIISFDVPLARRCAEYRAATRIKGLSLGDRACLALAERAGVPVYTADRPWLDLAVPLNLDIRCIRPERSAAAN